jgi:hypothetical protein
MADLITFVNLVNLCRSRARVCLTAGITTRAAGAPPWPYVHVPRRPHSVSGSLARLAMEVHASATTAAALAVGAAAGALVCGRCAPAAGESSGKFAMHDGATTVRWTQSDPRPLPTWTPAERKRHEELIRRAFALANEAVDNGNCPYAGCESSSSSYSWPCLPVSASRRTGSSTRPYRTEPVL